MLIITANVANALTRATRGRLIELFSQHGYYSPGLFFWSSQLPSIAFSYTGCAICGWLIARSRRSPAAFMLFAATVFLLEYAIAAFMLANAPSGRISPRGEWVLLLALIGRPLALFAGGLSGAKAEPLHNT